MLKKYQVVYLGNLEKVFLELLSDPAIELKAYLMEEGDGDDGVLMTLAEKKQIPLYRVSSNQDIRQAFLEIGDVNLGVIANFGIILDAQNLAAAKHGFVNLHFGLLPERPGRHPIVDAMQNKDAFTGATLHWATAQVDEGAVIAQKRVALNPSKVHDQIFERLEDLAAALLKENLHKIIPTPSGN